MLPKMPKWLVPALVILTVIALVPPALISRARATKSPTPRINLIPDMDYQLKFLPQAENPLFVDGRAMRPEIEGTIARGELAADDHYERGRLDGQWAATFPVPVTSELMHRGQERFEVYCSPCHGIAGFGDGLVSKRAELLAERGDATWTLPISMHDDTVRERPVGHIFNTISYGIRNMPAYGSQIGVADRWAIVAYIRALQRATKSSIADVPPDARAELR